MSSQRQSLRLAGYDYAAAGSYFVTVCVQKRECLLGEIVDGIMVMNEAGRVVDQVWTELPRRFSQVALDEYVVMPNHFHAIVIINDRRYSVPGQEKFANSYKISVSAILKKRVLSKETLFFNMA